MTSYQFLKVKIKNFIKLIVWYLHVIILKKIKEIFFFSYPSIVEYRGWWWCFLGEGSWGGRAASGATEFMKAWARWLLLLLSYPVQAQATHITSSPTEGMATCNQWCDKVHNAGACWLRCSITQHELASEGDGHLRAGS